MSDAKILLGMPSYTRRVDFGSAEAYWSTHSRPGNGFTVKQSWSRGGCSQNNLLSMALNLRPQGFTHLAMLHDDIEPAHWWLEALWRAMQETAADVVAATIAIKDARGLTSTGVFDPEGNPLIVRRLALAEAHLMPPYYTPEDFAPGKGLGLAINTGLFLLWLGAPWIEQVDLGCRMGLVRGLDAEGKDTVISRFESEDWLFSQQVCRLGGKAVAVSPKLLPVCHHGEYAYGNDEWGCQGTDQEYLDRMHERQLAQEAEAA